MVYWLRITVAAAVSAVERLLVRALVLLMALAVTGVAMVLGASLLAWPMAAARERRVDQRWAATLEPLLSLPDRVLTHAASPTALQIESVAAELGIDIAPPRVDDRPRPPARAVAAWSAVVEGFGEFGVELVRSAGSLPTVRPKVEQFLGEHRGAVEQLVKLAGQGIPPRWECDLDRGRDSPRPSEEGLRSIQRVLAAELVSRWHRGDRDGAAAVLTAAWRLNWSGFERPEMSSFLAAQATLAEHLAILRGMDPPPPGWLGRLVAMRLEKRYLQLLQVRSWISMRAIAHGESVPKADGAATWLRGPVARSLRRYAAADHTEAMRWAVEQLPLRPMVAFERGSFDAEMLETVPRWNRVARTELQGVASGWQRTQRAVAGLELAELILAARELDRAADRQLLDELAGSRPSRVRGMSWNIVVESDRLAVQLDGEPYPLPDPGSVALPLRATLAISSPPVKEAGTDVKP